MNLAETKALLVVIGTTYDRAIPPAKAEIWTEVLADVPFELAKAAAFAAFKVCEYPPQAADIIKHAEVITREARQREARHARAALEASKMPEKAPQTAARGAAMIRHVMTRTAEMKAAMGARRLTPAESRDIAEAAIAEWREQHTSPAVAERVGAHCENSKCTCTHTEGCEAGWIEVTPTSVRPCRACKPRTFAIVTDARSGQHASAQLRDTSDLDKEAR